MTADTIQPLSSAGLWEKDGSVLVNPGRFIILFIIQMGLVCIGVWASPVIAAAIFFGTLYAILCLINLKWAWAVILFSFPFSREVSFRGLSSALQVPTEPLCFIFVFVWLLRSLLKKRRAFLSSPLAKPIGLFLIVLFCSTFYSEFWIRTTKAWVNICWYILIGFVYPLNNLKNMRDVRFTVRILMVAVVLVSSFGLLYLFFPGLRTQDAQSGIVPDVFFPEHGSYSAYLSFYFAIALAFFIGSRNEIKRLKWFLAVLLLGCAVLLSFARAAWVGIIFLLLIMGMARWRDLMTFRTIFKLGAVLLLLLFVMGSMGLLSSIEQHARTVTDVEENVSNLERFHRWMVAINIFKDHPLLGIGTGTYEEVYPAYKIRALETPISRMYAGVHSEYLTILSENGLVGFVAWMAMLVSLYVWGQRMYRRTGDVYVRSLILGVLGGFTTYLVHAFFNDYLSYDKVAIPFWLCFGLVAVIGRITGGQGADDSPPLANV